VKARQRLRARSAGDWNDEYLPSRGVMAGHPHRAGQLPGTGSLPSPPVLLRQLIYKALASIYKTV